MTHKPCFIVYFCIIIRNFVLTHDKTHHSYFFFSVWCNAWWLFVYISECFIANAWIYSYALFCQPHLIFLTLQFFNLIETLYLLPLFSDCWYTHTFSLFGNEIDFPYVFWVASSLVLTFVQSYCYFHAHHYYSYYWRCYGDLFLQDYMSSNP